MKPPLKTPLNLLWRRRTLNHVMEGYFIREVLLGALGRPVRVHVFAESDQRPFLDHALIVSLGDRDADYPAAARARGHRNLGLFHMGDEYLEAVPALYGEADYAIRNYYSERVMTPPEGGRCQGIAWAPNGYRNGVGPKLSREFERASARPALCFFSGFVSSNDLYRERREMVMSVRGAGLPDCRIYGTREPTGGFSALEYAGLMEGACFALVPPGNSPETVRLYEALELGSIPIMLDAPFLSAAFGDPPFPILKSNEELLPFLRAHADRGAPAVAEAVDRLQAATLAWWQAFKRRKQEEIRALVDRSFATAGAP